MSGYILPEIPDRWDNIINQYDFIREALVMNIFDVDFKQLRLLSFEEDERTLVKEVKRIKESINLKIDGNKIYDQVLPNIEKIEYGSGGYVVTRGYYCPNLYETFTVGGCNRGKLLKRLTKKSKVSYEFCYVDNAMTMVKEYHDDPYSKKIGGIEFIERQGDIELGLYFTVVNDKIEKLLLINLSQFGDDKLINNRAILLHNKWEFEYEKNVYEYNNNLLVGIRHVEYSHFGTLKLSRKIKIDFIHAPDGCPVQFIVDGNKEIINDITKVNHEYYRREILHKMQSNKSGD